MKKRWDVCFDECNNAEIVEAEDGEFVRVDDINPLILRLATFSELDVPVSPDAHDDAVEQLRRIFSA